MKKDFTEENNFSNLKSKSIALFFTQGISIGTWRKIGFLIREVKWYNALSDNFSYINIFTYGRSDEKNINDGFNENIFIKPMKWIKSSVLYSFLLPFFYRSELKNIDIIKTNQMRGSWAAVLASKLYRKKLVIRCGYEWLQFIKFRNKNIILRFIAYIVEKISYSSADAIILTSNTIKKFVVDTFKIPSEKITVIPNFVDTDVFSSGESAKKEKGKILYFGRLDIQKNLLTLIDACKDLDVHVVMIGEGPDEKIIVDHAKKIGVELIIKKRMDQRELAKEVHTCEIFVQPSLFEGSPKTLLEALSCGAACIATNIESVREIITDELNGVVCEISEIDSNSIREKIVYLLNNPEHRMKIGDQARKFILNNYHIDKLLPEELKVYSLLL